MEPFSLGRLVRAVDGTCSASRGRVLGGVSTDTRTLRAGEAFFALSGPNFDGVRFVEAAFAAGAAACVVPADAPDRGHGPLVRVADVGQALLRFAASYRAELNPRVVAITGSAGKTTTKELVAAMLRRRRRTVAAPKSFNNAIGVPRTLFTADRRTEVVVLELGTNNPGEIAELAGAAQPDLAVITCVGAAHEGRLGGPEGVAREKLSLLEALRPGGAAILNGDDPRLRAAAGPAALVCGLDGGPCAWAGRWVVAGRTLEVTWPGGAPVAVELPVPGRPFAQDVLLALAVAERLGVPAEEGAAALADFTPPAGRFVMESVAGALLVDDTYNANPTSVLASLETFRSLGATAGRAVVLGGMLELGGGCAGHHRRVGRAVAEAGVDLLVGVGPEARAALEGARAAGLANVRWAAAAEEAAGALGEVGPGWAVLFKGSRAYRLERSVAAVRARLAGEPPEARAA